MLCLAPALYISWSLFGAFHDMDLVIELVESTMRRTSPWLVGHQFNHLPGFPVLLAPIGWMSQSASPSAIATRVKLLNLGFLIWFGWIAGKTAFPDTSDSRWRGMLYFSCHPLLVAIGLWHVQFEIPVLAFVLFSMPYWQSSSTGKNLWGGFYYGVGVSVKHWPLLALPVLLSTSPRKTLRLGAGILMGVVTVLTLHAVLNGHFESFLRIFKYSGIQANVGVLQVFGLPEPRGWNIVCLAAAVAAGLAIRLKGGRPAEAGMFTLLAFMLLSSRTAPQYWVWFLVFAPYCLGASERSFWLISGSLGVITLLLEWGFVLGWKSYPHATWQGNYPDLRDYPLLSSAALWLFEVAWRPLFFVAAVAGGIWYWQLWHALPRRLALSTPPADTR
jgi:hypothetical protein